MQTHAYRARDGFAKTPTPFNLERQLVSECHLDRLVTVCLVLQSTKMVEIAIPTLRPVATLAAGDDVPISETAAIQHPTRRQLLLLQFPNRAGLRLTEQRHGTGCHQVSAKRLNLSINRLWPVRITT